MLLVKKSYDFYGIKALFFYKKFDECYYHVIIITTVIY